MHRTQNIYMHIFTQRPIAQLTRAKHPLVGVKGPRAEEGRKALYWPRLPGPRDARALFIKLYRAATLKGTLRISLNDFSMSYSYYYWLYLYLNYYYYYYCLWPNFTVYPSIDTENGNFLNSTTTQSLNEMIAQSVGQSIC